MASPAQNQAAELALSAIVEQLKNLTAVINTVNRTLNAHAHEQIHAIQATQQVVEAISSQQAPGESYVPGAAKATHGDIAATARALGIDNASSPLTVSWQDFFTVYLLVPTFFLVPIALVVIVIERFVLPVLKEFETYRKFIHDFIGSPDKSEVQFPIVNELISFLQMFGSLYVTVLFAIRTYTHEHGYSLIENTCYPIFISLVLFRL